MRICPNGVDHLIVKFNFMGGMKSTLALECLLAHNSFGGHTNSQYFGSVDFLKGCNLVEDEFFLPKDIHERLAGCQATVGANFTSFDNNAG